MTGPTATLGRVGTRERKRRPCRREIQCRLRDALRGAGAARIASYFASGWLGAAGAAGMP